MAGNRRILKRFRWWDSALWWYSYSVGGFEGYRTPGGRKLACATMADALRDPSRRDEIRRLASRPRERFRPVLVVAGNYRQFRDWCRDTGHRERHDAVYVSSERVLRGRQGGTYVITGTGLERRDIADIERSLRIVGAAPMAELTPSPAADAGDPLVRIRLVPVEVFGAGEEDCPSCPAIVTFGYGLSDAVSAWSDCNRAIGHIYRVEDLPGRDSEGAPQCITVYVPLSEMAKFAVRFGEGGDRCPACKVPYDELPAGHQLSRPTCSGARKALPA